MGLIGDVFRGILAIIFFFFAGISFGAGFCVAWEAIRGGKK